MRTQDQLLSDARNGNINAFEALFSPFHDALKSYLFRLLANRNDAEDLCHDTFIKAFDNIGQFKGEASLRTWVFQIATNLAYNLLKHRKRWAPDVLEQAKTRVMADHHLSEAIGHVAQNAPDARYDIREHIDTCFTCLSKTLPVENQVALILKVVYSFSVKDIMLILEKSEGTVKYLLQKARATLTDLFDKRCSLVNQNGVCHQCSELNGWFNPKQDQQKALMEIDLVQGSHKFDREKLFALRMDLVKSIDPLRSPGHNLQETLLSCNRMVMGEVDSITR